MIALLLPDFCAMRGAPPRCFFLLFAIMMSDADVDARQIRPRYCRVC